MRTSPMFKTLSLCVALISTIAWAQIAPTSGVSPANLNVADAQAVYSIDGVRFAFATGGPIRSAPALADGVLFFGSGDGNFYALDAKSGRERWRFKSGGTAFSSPAVASGTVYFASRDSHLYALDAASGKMRWTFALGNDLGEGHYWDFHLSSPIVSGGTLYVGSGAGNVYALDAQTGSLHWTFAAGARVRTTPALVANTLVFGTTSGHVIALDVRDGKQRWKFATKGASNKFADKENDTTSIVASPSITEGIVAIGSRDGFIYGIDFVTGKQRWQTTHDGSSWILSTAADRGAAYIGSGSAAIVQAADPTTGAEKWRFKTRSAVFSSLAIAGELIYFGDFGGNLYAVDRSTGQRVWAYPLGDRIFATPLVADGVVYCGSDTGIMMALDGGGVRGSSGAAKKAIYWEGKKSAEAFNWFQDNVDLAILNYFKSAGYEQLDATQLDAFMSAQAAVHGRSVVVFADNRFPSIVTGDESADAPIRKYLDAGGKVALLGPNPLAYRADAKTGVVEKIDFAPVETVFGMHYPPLEKVNGYYASHTTATGEKWGLRGFAVSVGAIAPGQVTTVLAENEFGMATSWLKNFGGSEGTGLLQLNVPRLAPVDYLPYRMAIEHGID